MRKSTALIGVLGVGGPTKLYKSKRYKGIHQYAKDLIFTIPPTNLFIYSYGVTGHEKT